MGWRRYLWRRWWDQERARELQAHLDIETDEHIARGVPPDEARQAAHRKLGNLVRIREDIYDMNTMALVDAFWNDIRYGARLLRRDPAFTAVALLSLVLGIGANTAIFQLLDAVRLRTLPVSHPEELVEIRIAQPRSRAGNFMGRYSELAHTQWQQIQANHEPFSGVMAFGTSVFDLAEGGEVRRAQGMFVSGSFFDVLGVNAARGRVLSPSDDQRGCGARPAVISHAFWQREYGGDSAVLGRMLRLEGRPFEIVGVTPESFYGVEVGRQYDVAVPICTAPLVGGDAQLLDESHVWWLSSIARLRPGWSIARANAYLKTVSPGVFQETLTGWFDPDQVKLYLAFKLEAVSRQTGVSSLRADYETPLWLLLGLSALVLLTACANLANLLLARASARMREISVRLATGASRARIVRQLLAESLLLAFLGAVGGAILAQGASRSLVTFLSTGNNPVFVSLGLDWRVLAFTVAAALVTTLVFGLVPALRATAMPLDTVMRASGRSVTQERGRFGLQRVLVVGQVALSFVMVAGALLFALSLRNLSNLDTGLRQDGILVAAIETGRLGLPDSQQAALQRQMLDRIRAQSTVTAAAQTALVPLAGMQWNDDVRVGASTTTVVNTYFNSVSNRFFDTIGTPLVAGRDFNEQDRVGSPMVAIVNQTFTRKYLSGMAPVGQLFHMQTAPNQWTSFEIVGVAKDATYADLHDPLQPVAYLASTQEAEPGSGAVFLVRSDRPSAEVAASLRQAFAAVHPLISVRLRTLPSIVGESLIRDRLMATLSGCFGLLAAILASIGLYGVMAYMVARRRNEIGIRLALGADRRRVITMVMREAAVLVGLGLGLGAVLATMASATVSKMLFGLTPSDPTALSLAAGALAAVAIVASFVPAFRAGRLEPTAALRED